MFYKFFGMTHPNRGGHTQKTEKPDFRIRMNRDGSEKKLLTLNHTREVRPYGPSPPRSGSPGEII